MIKDKENLALSSFFKIALSAIAATTACVAYWLFTVFIPLYLVIYCYLNVWPGV